MGLRNRWDIFCTVVDNYGDIGVCWRLARQLASEHDVQARLWVDDLISFAKLAPELDPAQDRQFLCGVEIRRWAASFVATTPAEVVIEAFACDLPQAYIDAMAAQTEKPLWINLEYLSAENWVEDRHRLPSPHPQLALTKYFFFPGFTEKTGGLLREAGLIAARDAFQNDPQAQAASWRKLGVEPVPGALTISLFAYPSAPIAPLLAAWAASPTPIVCLVPETPLAAAIATALGADTLKPGQSIARGQLTLVGLPFLAQPDYDWLLWACDLNFVRGEDSFVRAQWAAKPLVWHIYPQHDAVHTAKLEAFTARYCLEAPAPAAQALAELWQAWNGLSKLATAWPAFAAALPSLTRHSQCWAADLAHQPDLATQLVKFSQNPL
jgi:uncharacterized repeat protein (TIGR03837 family)